MQYVQQGARQGMQGNEDIVLCSFSISLRLNKVRWKGLPRLQDELSYKIIAKEPWKTSRKFKVVFKEPCIIISKLLGAHQGALHNFRDKI